MSGRVYGEPFCTVPKRVVFSEVSVNAKVLYSIFACFVDDDGRCYPGRKRLAELMHVSEETVKRAKKELTDAGLIECHERFADDGRRTTDDVILTQARVTGDPYPRVMGDPTRTNANKERITTYAATGQNKAPKAGDSDRTTAERHEGFYVAGMNGSHKLTDHERQAGPTNLGRAQAALAAKKPATVSPPRTGPA